MAARLLSISYDRTLLMTRHLMLEESGFQVVSVSDMQELGNALESGAFDVFILGHSLPGQEKLRIFHLLREHSADTPILEIYKFSPDLSTGHSLSSQTAPQELIDAVNKVFVSRDAAS